jgi:hypothetical protein
MVTNLLLGGLCLGQFIIVFLLFILVGGLRVAIDALGSYDETEREGGDNNVA